MFYTIAEVADKFKLSKNALRYYESVDLLPKIKRDSLGIRQYTDADLSIINKVVRMRQLGASIAETRKFVQADSPSSLAELDEVLNFLNHLNQNLDEKISAIEQQKIFLQTKITHINEQKQDLLK